MKRHTVKLFSLIAVLALSLAAFFVTAVFAGAEETYSAISIFSSSVGATYDDTIEDGYVTYKMSAESNVKYNKNLALKWFDESGQAQYFTTTVSFGDLNFSKFSITLEAAQHTMNKDEKSVNTLTFSLSDDALSVYVNDKESVAINKADEYVITLTESAVGDKEALDGTTGEYYVTVNGSYAGTFTNIGSKYAEYKSSSMTPLTYQLDEISDKDDTQIVEIRQLNNQTLALENGKITDDAAPIFVLNDEIKVLKLGDTLSFDYKNIDVLDSSVTTEFYYFAYKGEARAEEDPGEEGSSYTKADALTKVVFMEGDVYENNNAYVSIAFKLSDGDNKAIYYIENYAASVTDIDGVKYVRVSKDVNSRPVYDTDASEIENYQAEVLQAALDEDGKSIQIGSGAYYYLPSLRSIISDEDCGYTELTFDIYYKNQTTESGSSTGLSYNALKFEIASSGTYEFKVVAKNKFGNVMQYTKDGKTYNITSSNVWDIDEIPSFTFTVFNNGPSIEESDLNDLGYIDVTFTFPSFEIIGLSGYSSEYKLYRMTSAITGLTVEEVNADPTKYEWTEIDDSDKDDDEDDNVYEWRPSSLSFVPQEKGFYMITVKVVDSDRLSAESHQVLSVTSAVDTVRGETYWLKNNILSVVFMAVGGLCLIGIIVLMVVKPKEDEETVSAEKSRKQALKEKREKRNK